MPTGTAVVTDHLGSGSASYSSFGNRSGHGSMSSSVSAVSALRPRIRSIVASRPRISHSWVSPMCAMRKGLLLQHAVAVGDHRPLSVQLRVSTSATLRSPRVLHAGHGRRLVAFLGEQGEVLAGPVPGRSAARVGMPLYSAARRTLGQDRVESGRRGRRSAGSPVSRGSDPRWSYLSISRKIEVVAAMLDRLRALERPLRHAGHGESRRAARTPSATGKADVDAPARRPSIGAPAIEETASTRNITSG